MTQVIKWIELSEAMSESHALADQAQNVSVVQLAIFFNLLGPPLTRAPQIDPTIILVTHPERASNVILVEQRAMKHQMIIDFRALLVIIDRPQQVTHADHPVLTSIIPMSLL